MFRCKRAFIEKAQHLRRCISLRTLPRGRLVPRQPRAIKGTTRTELRDEGISISIYIRWNTGMTTMALHHEGISIAKYIHWNTGWHLRRWPPYYTYNPGLADANLRLLNVQRLQRWFAIEALICIFHHPIYAIPRHEWMGNYGKHIMLMALDDSHRVLPHIIAFHNSRQIGVWFESYHTPICSISSRKMNGLMKCFQPSLKILTFCLSAASNKCDRAFASRGIWNSVEAFRQATACSCHSNTLDKHRA